MMKVWGIEGNGEDISARVMSVTYCRRVLCLHQKDQDVEWSLKADRVYGNTAII